MRSLLPKLAALLEKRYKLSRGAKKEIASLREEMSSMNALLLKLAARTQLDEQQRDWRNKVRELSYDMEDCIDIFINELDSGGDGLLSGLKKLQARYRIASRIQELKARAVETSDRHERYNGKLDETPRGLVAIDPRVQALYAEANGLVGMDGPKKKLVELLGMEEKVQQLKVISVVGSGGLGKTTLANQVYAAMKSQFKCRAFVSVSRNPSMLKVLSDIYSGICSRVPYDLNDECRLIDELREHLQDKRYAHMSNWISCFFTYPRQK
jgi:disease resistance protein RPM1